MEGQSSVERGGRCESGREGDGRRKRRRRGRGVRASNALGLVPFQQKKRKKKTDIRNVKTMRKKKNQNLNAKRIRNNTGNETNGAHNTKRNETKRNEQNKDGIALLTTLPLEHATFFAVQS